MQIVYSNTKIEKACIDFRTAQKKYPFKIAKRLMKAVGFIEEATSLKAIINNGIYRFHDLKGKRAGQYALDIGSTADGYRLIVTFEEGIDVIFSEPETVTKICIYEMGNYYE